MLAAGRARRPAAASSGASTCSGAARPGRPPHGRFGIWLATYATAVRVCVVAVAAVGYLAVDHPTGSTALTFLVVTAVVLLVLELLMDKTSVDPTASPDG